MTEKKDAHWASTKLVKSYLDSCTRLLWEFESSTKIKPEACLRLWWELGALRHDVWFGLTESERRDIDAKSRDLVTEVRSLLKRRRQQILACLESGIAEVLGTIINSRQKVERFHGMKQIGSTYTSLEFNADLLSHRDELGFVSLLMEELGVSLSPSQANLITLEDAKLKKILPMIMKAYYDYDKVNDDPTPHPDRFPRSFWWREMSSFVNLKI